MLRKRTTYMLNKPKIQEKDKQGVTTKSLILLRVLNFLYLEPHAVL